MDLLRFLLGDRRAILRFANEPATLWIALVWVLSASLARRYDAVYLPAEPQALVMPALVSFVNASILFAVVWVVFKRRADPTLRLGHGYRVILSLFWLTAPLALLYALPVERFEDPYGAMVANLWLLLVVALWRVLLMARILSVVFGVGFWAPFFLVMTFADVVAVVLLLFGPGPIIAIMGGIAHTPADALLVDTTMMVTTLGFYSFPLWILGSVIFSWLAEPSWQVDRSEAASETGEATSWRKRQWVLASLSILVWLPILPLPQAEQRLAHQVDTALAEGRIERALEILRAHPRDEFPPHFRPRPRKWKGQDTPDLWLVLEEVAEHGAPDWGRRIYLEKLDRELQYSFQAYASQVLELAPRLEGMDAIIEKREEDLREWAERSEGENQVVYKRLLERIE